MVTFMGKSLRMRRSKSAVIVPDRIVVAHFSKLTV
jgi:hypothetical protein